MGIREGRLYSASKDRDRNTYGWLSGLLGEKIIRLYGERDNRSLPTEPSNHGGEAIIKVEDLLKRDKSPRKGLKRLDDNLVKGEEKIQYFR